MAKVYGGFDSQKNKLPKLTDFKTDSGFDMIAYNKANDDYVDEIISLCKEYSTCPDAGEIISFFVGDGCAMYAVLSYRELIHIGIRDGYAIPDTQARGIRKADIIQEINIRKSSPPPMIIGGEEHKRKW